MKHLFIVNPKAGGKDRTAEVTELVNGAFTSRSEDFEIYVTRGIMDAAEKVRRAAEEGTPLRVYACGGDGTFNECCCGAAGFSHVAVCPFPVGTGNDFCRMFGTEADLFRNINALLNGSVHPIDLIDCNGRLCVNICSVGIDARIGADVHKYSKIPLIGGATGYVVSLVANVFAGINRPMHVRCGEYSAAGEHALVCVCNGRYYGGGFNPSPDARPDDGELDIFIVDRVRLSELPALLGKYAKGRADEIHKHVVHRKGTSVIIDFEEDNVVNIDGEAIYTKHVQMEVRPNAVNLIVPKGLHFFG